jgi:hypothetical protein
LTRKPGALFTGSGRRSICLTKSGAALKHFGIGTFGGNDFDQRHLGHRVEEMDSDQPFRPRQHGPQVLDAQARGIGRQHCVRPDARFELLEQGLLGPGVLEDGLDHHVGLACTVPFGIGNQAIHDVAQLAHP